MRSISFVASAMILSAPLARADLIANVTVTPGPSVWSYTLFNNEPTSSSDFITSFSLWMPPQQSRIHQ